MMKILVNQAHERRLPSILCGFRPSRIKSNKTGRKLGAVTRADVSSYSKAEAGGTFEPRVQTQLK